MVRDRAALGGPYSLPLKRLIFDAMTDIAANPSLALPKVCWRWIALLMFLGLWSDAAVIERQAPSCQQPLVFGQGDWGCGVYSPPAVPVMPRR